MRRQRPTATITATEEGALTAASTSAAAVTSSGGKAAAGRAVVLERVPLALTCGLYRSHVLVDPTSEEEALAGSLVTVVLDQGGTLHGRKVGRIAVLKVLGFRVLMVSGFREPPRLGRPWLDRAREGGERRQGCASPWGVGGLSTVGP